METMSTSVDVTDPYAGSADISTRQQWRRNRNAAYRAAYAEVNGEPHPASEGGQPKEDLDRLLDEVEVPTGMSWSDFGVTWDLHPDHPLVPVLRKRSVESEWARKQAAADAEAEASD